jgi:hypothetical protein
MHCNHFTCTILCIYQFFLFLFRSEWVIVAYCQMSKFSAKLCRKQVTFNEMMMMMFALH